ncbi:helix-turn-helix domain-containing protein [Bradyrhizobium mercantei]|uniref:helix-turn-helix domain-containing protein n=1 Tax=Bradyrhizobium mercantei TaxID=1904807 RepID=UPI00097742FB|nr:helix-turn-helix domain-containing protein [Bradyrhizobium mercantei]
MTKAGRRLLDAAREAVAIAKGERTPARINVPPEIDVQSIRSRLGLSQEEFAAKFGFTSSQIKDWEQGHSRPLGSERAYLMVIKLNSQAVLDVFRDASKST